MNLVFRRMIRRLVSLSAACVGLGAVVAGRAVELHRERASPYDLALTGRIAGVPAGETRYVRWADLRALPTTKITLTGEFVAGEQEVTALFLAELWKELPRGEGVDVMLASCTDGYAAVYREDFIARYRPFVVLEINGEGPGKWPPRGLTFNPGPYVISVSPQVAPAVAGYPDANHKRPWGVQTVELGRYADRFREIHTGKWAAISERAQEGRELWVNSCASCHHGPGTVFGGTKSDRPWEVTAAHAGYNQAYFKRYVRDPKGVIAGAKMEAHPHYTDAQLEGLIAFITAEPGQPPSTSNIQR